MKDLVKKEEQKQALMTEQKQSRGYVSEVSNEDIIIPRAKLLQNLSPEILDRVKNLNVGDIINNITQEKLPETFIPILFFKNWIRWNPRKKDDRGFDPAFPPAAMIWRTNNPRDERVLNETAFGPNGEKPLATTYLNFLGYFEGESSPIVISFSKTSFKAGKLLLSLCKLSGGDLWNKKYKLISIDETKDGDTYKILKVAPAGNTSEDEKAVCEAIYEEMKNTVSNIVVDEELEDTISLD